MKLRALESVESLLTAGRIYDGVQDGEFYRIERLDHGRSGGMWMWRLAVVPSMTFEEYQVWAHGRLRHEKARLTPTMTERFAAEEARKRGQHYPSALTLALASFAHMTEAGEAGDNVKKFVFHGKEWDEIKPKLLLELGDDLWYFAVKLKECGITLQEVIDANVAKLNARDGEKGEKFHDRKL